MTITYSPSFKEAALQKLLAPANRPVREIAEEMGCSAVTLYDWKKKCGSIADMKKHNDKRRPKDWTAEEKFSAIFTYEKLPPEEQGAFLRKHGLHTEHIEAWKKSMKMALDQQKTERAHRLELLEKERTIKELKNNLQRKDKALAETTALLVLKKKVSLILGEEEE